MLVIINAEVIGETMTFSQVLEGPGQRGEPKIEKELTFEIYLHMLAPVLLVLLAYINLHMLAC